MARSVSNAYRVATSHRLSDEHSLALLTITGDGLSTTVRLSDDPTQRISEDPLEYGTISRGDTFKYMPLSVVMPQDSDEEAPRVKLRLDNMHRDLIEALRSFRTPLAVKIERVLRGQVDTVDMTLPEYLLRDVQVNELAVEAELRLENLSDEPFPAHRMTPSYTPAIFRSTHDE